MRWLPDGALDHLREVAAEPDLSGTPYEIAGIIGRGGMGTVYLARDRDLDREVALKVVELDGEDTERMLREARILARLEHPGIVPVHDVGTLPDGRAWYVMKRVRGRSLDEHARTLSLPDRLRAGEDDFGPVELLPLMGEGSRSVVGIEAAAAVEDNLFANLDHLIDARDGDWWLVRGGGRAGRELGGVVAQVCCGCRDDVSGRHLAAKDKGTTRIGPDRRLGIPLTLGIIYLEVGWRVAALR